MIKFRLNRTPLEAAKSIAMTTVAPISLIVNLIAFLLVSPVAGQSPKPAAPRPVRTIADRMDFAKRWSRLEEGMTEKQVLAMLGPPDRKGDYLSPDYRAKVGWFYGCAGPRQFPTLGTLSFDEKDRLIFRGVNPREIPPPEMTEVEMRAALVAIDESPGDSDGSPALIVRAANRLLPLGKEKILAAAWEYHRVNPGKDRPNETRQWTPLAERAGQKKESSSTEVDDWLTRVTEDSHTDDVGELRFLLRVLFEPPDAKHPEKLTRWYNLFWPYVTMMRPADPMLCPRWPVGMGGDVPLVELFDGFGSGIPAGPADDIIYYQAHGVLREHPLRPPDNPLDAMNAVLASGQWLPSQRYRMAQKNVDGETVSEPRKDSLLYLHQPILMMLAPLYPEIRRPYPSNNGNTELIDLGKWDAVVADLKQHPVRWDEASQAYVRK